jgi:hypothetical protein
VVFEMSRKIFVQPWLLILNLLLLAVVTAFAPLERTLGTNIRLIYFHGAWVWVGKLAFGAAAVAGLGGLVLRHVLHPGWAERLPAWALALGRTGLFFWVTYLPMSLAVMQMNWGGLFLDEPRFRIPLMFGVVGLLLQAGFFLLDQPDLVCLGSLVYGVTLWIALGEITNVLHPDSPIYTSDSFLIQAFFSLILALSVLIGVQIAAWIYRFSKKREHAG